MKRRQFLGATGAAALSVALLRQRAIAETNIPAELGARRLDNTTTALRTADIQDLRDGLRGPLLLPGDADYDSTRRIWNAAFDRRPALIVRCAGAADIARTLQFASTHQLLTAVRGGGHSLSGQSVCDGGLMIDLSLMRSVRVDPARRIARIEPGVLLGDLDREALAFGQVTTTGTVSHTGAAGLTLGGGTGRLSRRFGLAIDNLSSIDIVTPDGTLRSAHAGENQDLFWGSRGGGGNFGVVSSFEYRLRPFEPRVYGGVIWFPFTRVRELLQIHAEMQLKAPVETWSELALGRTAAGERYVEFDVCHSGKIADGERLLKPLLDSGKALRGSLGATHYRSLQTHADVRARHGVRRYMKGGYLRELSPDFLESLAQLVAQPAPTDLRIILVPGGGGAVARVPPNATAFWHRDMRYSVNVGSSWDDVARGDESVATARATFKSLERFTHGFYGNSMTDRGASDMHVLYGGNLERLRVIKRRYDPANLLRMNANVTPA
jgi:FAD/FMN-containing dehydrogenase